MIFVHKVNLVNFGETRESRSWSYCFLQEKAEKPVLDVIDQVFPTVLEKVLHSIPQSEKV